MSVARLVFFAIVALSIAFAPNIAPLKEFSDELLLHPQPWLGIAIGMTVLGIAVFIVAGVVTAFDHGRRMTDAEAQRYASAALRVPKFAFYRGYFRGKAVGQQVETSNSFSDIKDAFRTGVWWRDPGWRRFLLMIAGALLWLYGGFAIAFVLGPPAVKLIFGSTLFYASARAVWSVWRA